MDPFMLTLAVAANEEANEKLRKRRFTATDAHGIVAKIARPLKREPEFRLSYFDARGDAESIRFLLAYAGVPFIDRRLDYNEWLKEKQDAPYPTLPMLEWNGKKLCESMAISRMLAKLFGLDGHGIFEQAQVDALLDMMKDFGHGIRPFFMASIMAKGNLTDKMEVERKREEALPALKKYMPLVEKAAAKAMQRSGFLFESGITHADFCLANCFVQLNGHLGSEIREFKAFKAHSTRIHNLPQLQFYLNMRPKTCF